MTPIIKSYEFVEYHNNLLQLTSSGSFDKEFILWPLETYLKTLNISGKYGAKWLIIGSKFYLKELFDCDERFRSNFDLKEPLLATWVNGALELGIEYYKESYGEKKYFRHFF